MVAPVLAVLGALGVFGGRSLIAGRTRRQSAETANAPFQAALNSQLSGPPLPAGQEGPTRSQAGFSQEQQGVLLGLMQNGNAEAAFAQGQIFQGQNTTARNLQIQELNASAGIAQKNQEFGLKERIHEFNVAGRLAEKDETARLRAEAQAGLFDLELGARQAALATPPRDEFSHFDQAGT